MPCKIFFIKLSLKAIYNQLMAERLTTPGSTGAIDCYTCTSMGGSDRKCEDPVYKEFLNVTPNCQVNNFFLDWTNLYLTQNKRLKIKLLVYSCMESLVTNKLLATKESPTVTLPFSLRFVHCVIEQLAGLRSFRPSNLLKPYCSL